MKEPNRHYTIKKAEQIVELFNQLVPIGTRVIYHEVISGWEPYACRPFETTTRSAAQLACVSTYGKTSANPVVFLRDKAGWVCIDHIEGWFDPRRVLKSGKPYHYAKQVAV